MGPAAPHHLARGVVARVHEHVLRSQVGDVPCWTYVTDGLRASGQQEIAFTHVRPSNGAVDQAPQGPLQLLATVAALAQQGRLVGAGGVTEIGPRGLFGVPTLRGVAYERAWPMRDVFLPADTLTAVALVDPEMEIAKRYGVLRVLARLGRAHSFFPTAPWCEPGRAALMAAESKTILEGVARAPVSGIVAAIGGDRVSLRLPHRALPPMREFLSRLPPGAAMRIAGVLASNADACLVWSPGQKGPEAISAPGGRGTRISANFVLFATEQPADGAGLFEDGVVAMLSGASWSRVRTALARGESVAIAAQDPRSKSLTIEWC